MAIPELSSKNRNEKSVPYREKPNRTWICTYSSGRLQSEMSFTNRRRVTASTHFFTICNYRRPILILVLSVSVVPDGDVVSVNLS